MLSAPKVAMTYLPIDSTPLFASKQSRHWKQCHLHCFFFFFSWSAPFWDGWVQRHENRIHQIQNIIYWKIVIFLNKNLKKNHEIKTRWNDIIFDDFRILRWLCRLTLTLQRWVSSKTRCLRTHFCIHFLFGMTRVWNKENPNKDYKPFERRISPH